MKITNNHNLPEPIYNAIKKDDHKMGDYSASGLYKSPRMMQLTKRHDKEIVIDAQSRIWALLGTSVHAIIEKGTGTNQLSEAYMEVDILGKKLSGASDLLSQIGDNIYGIDDYKVTSAWSIVYGSSIIEWEKQLNTYAFLFGKYGFKVGRLQIVAILRDWQKSKSKYDREYPQSQIVTVPIRLWTPEEQEKYITDSVEKHESHKDTPDYELPLCTDYERWKDPEKFAVMKKGAKKAARVLSTKLEAETYMEDKGLADKTHFIETRESIARRCEDYCDCNQFCNQYCLERDMVKGE
jgi:hypothetical protein